MRMLKDVELIKTNNHYEIRIGDQDRHIAITLDEEDSAALAGALDSLVSSSYEIKHQMETLFSDLMVALVQEDYLYAEALYDNLQFTQETVIERFFPEI